MTNGEKFKTVDERIKQFNGFCAKRKCDICKCTGKGTSILRCAFEWLDLKYEEELKKCPFCGSDATTVKAEGRHYVSCVNDDCIASVAIFSSEDEAIAAWNRRV